MKKLILLVLIAFYGQSKACAWYEPDYEYFNVFTQNLIPNKAYQPFLLTYSSPFYEDENAILDENIEAWQKFFNNDLNYEETRALVTLVDIKHLNNIKSGKLSHPLFQKTGVRFYTKYKEAMDYLIQAKYMEPYMRIQYQENPDSFYYPSDSSEKNATQLNYAKTIAALKSLYNAAKNPEIKLRYGYQMVRFNHYSRKFAASVNDFKKYVEPLKKDTPIYWYALDQKAGAERGLLLFNEANYDFFQVFMHSRNKKKSAYNSMKFSNNSEFESLVKMAKNAEEKNVAYFLLAYNKFNNPVSIMEKMLQNNANSDILKVLAARSINELERSYLPIYVTCGKDCKTKDKRLPLYNASLQMAEGNSEDYTVELGKFIAKARAKSDDDYWKMADAYIQFLYKDYAKSLMILNQIKTNDSQYLEEIKKLKMLNDIVSQPKITEKFEVEMITKYGQFFTAKPKEQQNYWENGNSTTDFIRDILANRYFLQGEDGKSFLMNNQLSDLQYNPNSELVKKVEAFYKKNNKNPFEKYIAENLNNVGNTDAFFNVIYGDFAMRNAQFAKAKEHYQAATNFTGIPRTVYHWNEESRTSSMMKFDKNQYDGFKNISNLIFGHNIWESFGSAANESMKAENTKDFPFIKNSMTKLELANAAIQLENTGKGNSEIAAKANQLLGNLLYNTSLLGYYRHVFVMDVTNENGPKFNGGYGETDFHYYYKNFSYNSFIEPDNFDLALNYYQKALAKNNDREEQARILFQMASAEQGKYYQAESENSEEISYSDSNYEAKMKAREAREDAFKNSKFRNNFALLKSKYADTKTVKSLRNSCSYFEYYMRK
ncbi:hypothetical protein [Frigoriflavimonas asaccharolytica]|uniref:Tetratricopeptide repeat protein n=1 Tax=Frigoriflavimonas asaccharolytica TaxID=2735899 RepID=A0A8J8G9E0_9FLAO|nr:hypothetical protein [Frigoriflavimonas asaccharolytica]NRS93548.1 hypothetical protein [Frigoriflavimonas asaccharolytica]